MEYPEVMTVNEVAKLLRLAPVTVLRKSKKGELPAILLFGEPKIGYRFLRKHIEELLK